MTFEGVHGIREIVRTRRLSYSQTRPKVRAGQVPPNGLRLTIGPHYSGVQRGHEHTVVVAVESDKVREALVAMLAANGGFSVVADTSSADAALEAARRQHPRLVLIDPELSDCDGWWVIQQIRSEQLACAVVALGRHANGTLAQLAGAESYVQVGISPRDLLTAIETAMAFRLPANSGPAKAEQHLLPDAHAVLDEPALVDL
jgi:DNA-binding NarL/FixJ family response regulator